MPERVLAAAGLFAAANFCLSHIVPAAVPSPAWLLFAFGRVDGTVDGSGDREASSLLNGIKPEPQVAR